MAKINCEKRLRALNFTVIDFRKLDLEKGMSSV
ncbi:hypothetical protein BACERE00183_02955 [Bacillus cereus]|nr:hypothetical protein BACERE00183_02955 [Bacillus cereus]